MMQTGRAIDFEIDGIGWVSAIARKMLRTIPAGSLEHEELLSEGLVALSEALQNFDRDRQETFKAYAYVRVKGAMLDRIRREARRYTRVGELISLTQLSEMGLDPVAPRKDCPEQQFLKMQLGTVLLRLINQITERDRAVLIHHAVFEHTHSEIAAMNSMKTRSFATKALQRSRVALIEPCKAAGLADYLSAA